MLIYFVRHGQTDWNKALRWQGSSDIELNRTGREQARAIRQWFNDQNIEPPAIVSSPKKRARTTAEGIAATTGLTVISEPVFCEVGLGEFEGKTTEELQDQYGSVFEQWIGAFHLVAPPGGENLEQAIKRMSPKLKSYIEHYGDQLVVVAHQAILMAMKAALANDLSPQSLAAYKQANYEIDVWDFDNSRILRRVDIRSN